MNFDAAIAVLKARLAELDSHVGVDMLPLELAAQLVRERGAILLAIEELGGEVE